MTDPARPPAGPPGRAPVRRSPEDDGTLFAELLAQPGVDEVVALRSPFGFLDARTCSTSLLNEQTPEQDAAGNQFDDAINAKALQRDAAGRKAHRDRDAGLNGHPQDRHQFDPDSQTHIAFPGGSGLRNASNVENGKWSSHQQLPSFCS